MPVSIQDMTFGVEIECIAAGTYEATRDVILAAGVNAAIGSYSTRNRADEWLVKSDGSLSHGGREVVSPILRGAAGIATLHTVITALNTAGHTADRSCGIHVHIGAAGFTAREIAGVFTRYAIFGAEIVATLAPNRGTNHYCATPNAANARTNFPRVTDATPINMVANLMGQHTRYSAVNLQTLLRGTSGTFEFRQHQGSVNADRVCMWVEFLREFVAQTCVIVNAPIAIGANVNTRANPFKRQSSEQAKMWDALNRGEPMTAEQLSIAVGVDVARVAGQIANVRRNCEKHGAPVVLVVTRGRRNAPTTYSFAHAVAARGIAATGVDWGSLYDGISEAPRASRVDRADWYANPARRAAARAAAGAALTATIDAQNAALTAPANGAIVHESAEMREAIATAVSELNAREALGANVMASVMDMRRDGIVVERHQSTGNWVWRSRAA